MQKKSFRFQQSVTDLYTAGSMARLKNLVNRRAAVIITDENVYQAHTRHFSGWNTIVLKAGEEYKVQATVDAIIEELIAMEADRTTTLIGVGGGVITDLTGYVAAVYMRGLSFGFIPTTVLALVDASIGGKNGIDVGIYKNMVGIIRQPSFILHDPSLLRSLPQAEWQNGFAEIIKHACIKDATMFAELEKNKLDTYQRQPVRMSRLVERNARLKMKVVQRDEFEKNERRLLNFGHTLGHALENQYELMHGQAVSIGMTYACHISESQTGFRQTDRVVNLLNNYGLPTYAAFEKEKVFAALKMDKKREQKDMHYVLLQRIGRALIKPIPLNQLKKIIQEL